jgi:hypothetical protein
MLSRLLCKNKELCKLPRKHASALDDHAFAVTLQDTRLSPEPRKHGTRRYGYCLQQNDG